MPLFLIVTKLLLLKSFWLESNCLAYEYGYHPSAEEFDNLMRETSRTWTRDLLANERRRNWFTPIIQHRRSDTGVTTPNLETRAGEYFVPRYSYEKHRRPYETTLNLKWPGYAEKIVRKPQKLQTTYNDQHDQQSAPSSVNTVLDSNLDFTMFSNENGAETEVINSGVDKYNKPSSPVMVNVQYKPAVDVTRNPISAPLVSTETPQGAVIQIEGDVSSERAQTAMPTWQQKYSLNNLYKNNSEAHFPIFFTNPVTGIVYAITEIGRMEQNSTMHNQQQKDNGTIPIYITKEQYDRDILQLQQRYEKRCSNSATGSTGNAHNKYANHGNGSSVISNTLFTSTQRPQIIRLQKPASGFPTISKLPIAKLPVNLKQQKPPPVMVQTAVTVSDQVQLPPPKRLQKVKNKKKKKKRPGRKPAGLVTRSPIITSSTKGTLPHIIVGTRTTTARPTLSKEKFTTQLERPSLPTTTIFSSSPIVATKGYMSLKGKRTNQQANPYPNHRLSRRSVPTNEPHSLSSQNLTTEPTLPSISTLKKTASGGLVGVHRLQVRKKALPRLVSNATKLARSHATNNTLKFNRKRKTGIAANSTKVLNHNHATTTPRNLQHSRRNSTKSQKPKHKKRGKDEDTGFNIFDLLDDDDDDDDEDEDAKDKANENDSDYYYYEEVEQPTTKKPKRHIFYTLGSSQNDDDEPNINADSQDDLKEQSTHENSSSAEEGADFGALEEFDTPTESQHEATPESDSSSYEKQTTYNKKRIRRRPAVSSYEDEDDDDDDGGGGGVSGFFRMLFYPMQMAMSRFFETFAGMGNDKSVEEFDEVPPYPTYTQYSSALNTPSSISGEEEAEQGYSLSNWFSSLFGFNRRTKNIGSTTAAPPLVLEPTEAPGWLDSWLGFGGSKATSASSETSSSYEDYDDYDKWFSSWFSTKPKAKRRTATTSTTTTTATMPQVPILTIVDPMRNPQNWLGILAHHIVNSTTTTTHNPLIEAWTRATTTENPDIPRYISYDKYQIWRLRPQDEAQVKVLEEYKRTDEGVKLQWLKGPSLRGLTDVIVPPKMLIDFQGTLQFESIAHEILIFDVGKVIAYEQSKEQYYLTTPNPPKNQQKQKYASLINMSWNKYYAYDDIVKYLESVRMRYPQIVELLHIGRSYEGRPLIVVKLEMKHSSNVSNGNLTQTNRKKLKHKKKSGQANAVFIEAGTHGMEWIGPATATWMINELLRIMKSNKTTIENEYIRNTSWFIMPVLNPDGYVYSHEYDRFWKKSRSRHISRSNGLLDSAMTWLQQKKSVERICYGVDLDRNWHYQWGKRGSSKSPCNEFFAGTTPFSEPETKALSEFLMDYRKQIKLYVSMQAYGQIISYPVKTNASFNAERMEDFLDVAMVGTDGLRKTGSKSRYKVDSSNDLVEHRAGCSDAFAAYEVGIPFSYTIHLADNGVHGYLLPSNSIEPTARDAFEIVTAMLDYI